MTLTNKELVEAVNSPALSVRRGLGSEEDGAKKKKKQGKSELAKGKKKGVSQKSPSQDPLAPAIVPRWDTLSSSREVAKRDKFIWGQSNPCYLCCRAGHTASDHGLGPEWSEEDSHR